MSRIIKPPYNFRLNNFCRAFDAPSSTRSAEKPQETLKGVEPSNSVATLKFIATMKSVSYEAVRALQRQYGEASLPLQKLLGCKCLHNDLLTKRTRRFLQR